MSQYMTELVDEFYAIEGRPFGPARSYFVFANNGFYRTERAAQRASKPNKGERIWRAKITWEEVE